jgi:hypothetical protein
MLDDDSLMIDEYMMNTISSLHSSPLLYYRIDPMPSDMLSATLQIHANQLKINHNSK